MNSNSNNNSNKRKDSLAILGLVLLGSGMLPDIAIAHDTKPNSAKHQNNNDSQLLAQSHQQSAQTEKEQQAFFASQYTYWDAFVLSKFWNQNLGDTKARMGRKILWGPADKATLDQYLLDGRIKALNSVNSSLNLYPQSSYSYKDAQALANFWGDATPYDAKVRIEKNLIMGNEKAVKKALVIAKNKAPVHTNHNKAPANPVLISCGTPTGPNNNSQAKIPAAANLSLQSGIQAGANGRNRIPINRTDPAYTVQKLDISPAIYLDVTFPDGTKAGPHDYKKNFASNIIFDDKSGDPNDLIKVLYWNIDPNNPQRGKYAAQVTSTGKGTGTAYLKVSFRNAPDVTSTVAVEVVSGTSM